MEKLHSDASAALEQLRMEYLKMNRLTQKIVDHFLQAIGDCDFSNFLLFLVRVIFGEHIEKKIQLGNLAARFRAEALSFRDYVQQHLKAAEELVAPKKGVSKAPAKKKAIINNRLGNLLFPPERVLKFNSILNGSNQTVLPKERESRPRVFHSEGRAPPASRSAQLDTCGRPEGLEDLASVRESQNALIIPTVRKLSSQSPETPCLRREVAGGGFPNFRKRIEYLKYQIDFYQSRIEHFYESLCKLSLQRQQSGGTQGPRGQPKRVHLKGLFSPTKKKANLFAAPLLGKRGFLEGPAEFPPRL